jgi:hypothetical protein
MNFCLSDRATTSWDDARQTDRSIVSEIVEQIGVVCPWLSIPGSAAPGGGGQRHDPGRVPKLGDFDELVRGMRLGNAAGAENDARNALLRIPR